VFVRLSKDTMLDNMLPAWLETCRKNTALPEGVMVFQIAEEAAASHLKQTREMAIKLRKIGFGLSIEGFTAGASSAQLLSHMPIDYLKIDGSLMQGLAADEPLQERVRAIAQEARSRNIRPSPSASRTRTPWRCCGSWACSTSRVTRCGSPRSCCRWTSRHAFLPIDRGTAPSRVLANRPRDRAVTGSLRSRSLYLAQ
jgi:hypothetical protein